MDETRTGAPVAGFYIFLYILAVLMVIVGAIAIGAGFSERSDGEINIGFALAIAGILFASFGIAINKLAQIEWHLRESSKRKEKKEL